MAKVLTTQPFPFNHYDNNGDLVPCGITTGRYVKGTVTEMMRLYWKVKKYNVSGSFTNYTRDDPNLPNSVSYFGTVDSDATTETDLVCPTGTTSNIAHSGAIGGAFLNLQWQGADFYFNSSPTQPIVKLYGEITFDTDQDETSGITTSVGGSLSAFIIDGFQVYEGTSIVNYQVNGAGPIDNFSASISASELWQYQG